MSRHVATIPIANNPIALDVIVNKVVPPNLTYYESASRFLTERLNLARDNPAELAQIIEAEMIQGLSDLNRMDTWGSTPGRRAGGGKLTKGS